MTYQEDQHSQAKSDMLDELNKAILDAEDLRKAETEVSDARSAAAQENPEQEPDAGTDAARVSRTAVETEEK